MIETPPDFFSAVEPETSTTGEPISFLLAGDRVLVHAEGLTPADRNVIATHFAEPRERHYLGRLGTRPCWLYMVEDEAPPSDDHIFTGMRALFASGTAAELAILSRALQVAEWSRSHRFCGACGTPTHSVPGERARHCPGCGHTAYPRLSPAIMVLITRGRELLLARATRFKHPMWSALAGFVEPGESLEDCLRREVREEVGLEVARLEYFGSQSWPFPHSLMIAFTAQHAGGDITPDGNEIAEAGWFAPDQLPPLPPSASIARHLIDSVAARLRQ